MNPLRLLFMGTAPIAVPALRACAELQEIDLLAVVTQPPSRRGRGRKALPSAIEEAARAIGLPICTPERFAGDGGDAVLDAFEPDACLVMAYGQIIKAPHLARCPQRWLNLHGSLLPRWRGAAPIERCLEAGDIETGIQLMQMETGLDTGAIYAERRLPTKGHNAQTLSEALALEAAALTRSSLVAALQGELEPVTQDPARACYAKRVEKSEGLINFLGSADLWARRSRAFNPRLGLRCRIEGQKKSLSLKIWDAEVVAGQSATEPGAILRADGHGLWVSCEIGVLNIVSLQLDGKKRLLWSQFKSGLVLEPNDCFT